ncbi:MAG: site-specific integrase [Deltaproteobacteria bacterium]|jgi:integrase|nr:site-specific integrase [Deltaproteobacteria bacterium]
MKATLTLKFVESLPPCSKRQIIFDTKQPALALFVTRQFNNNQGRLSGGHKSFYLFYKTHNGPKRQLHLGAFPYLSPNQARAKAKELLTLVYQGIDPASKTEPAAWRVLTVDGVLDLFFEEYVEVHLKKQTLKSYRSFRRTHLSPALGQKKIVEVSYEDMSNLHGALRHKPTTANRLLSLCSKFFNWCEKKNYRQRGSNPTKGIERYQENPILRFLTQEQMKLIWEAVVNLDRAGKLNPLPVLAFKLLILTGARKNEILGLKWSDIEFQNSRAILSESKTGFKVIHLPQQAIELLKKLPQEGVYVFPSSSVSGHLFDLQWQWQKVLEESGLKGRWRIHDLRHGFASAAVNSGGSLAFIGFLLGHKKSSTTERYAHVAQNPAQALLNQVAQSIVDFEPPSA